MFYLLYQLSYLGIYKSVFLARLDLLSWCSSVAGLFLQREMSNAINRASFYRLSVAARPAYRRTTVSYVSVINFSTGLVENVAQRGNYELFIRRVHSYPSRRQLIHNC